MRRLERILNGKDDVEVEKKQTRAPILCRI